MFKSIEECKRFVTCDSSYKFLECENQICGSTALLALAGSFAYGTNTSESDIDLRGIAVNNPRGILLGTDFKSWTHDSTDTTIYSFNRFAIMAAEGNPHAMELLGIPFQNIISISPAGRLLLDNKNMFITQRIIGAYSGYAKNQSKELDKQLARVKYLIDNGGKADEISLWKKRANKSMMHIVRLYLTAIDMLEGKGIIIQRTEEHNLLMSLRSGNMLGSDCNPTKEYLGIEYDLSQRFKYAAKNTCLPENYDRSKVEDLVIAVNKEEIKQLFR